MDVLSIALGAACALLAVVTLILLGAGRARARSLADEIRHKVEPYVRRKSAEAGLPADAPTWTSRTTPEEIVGYSARLAARLNDQERSGPPLETVRDLELANTQRVEESDKLVVDAAAAQRRR
jgi:hypothetical protein